MSLKNFGIVISVLIIVFTASCGAVDSLEEAYKDKDWDKVSKLAKQVIEKQPDNYQGYYYLGLMYNSQEKWIITRKQLEKVRELNRQFFEEKDLGSVLSNAYVREILAIKPKSLEDFEKQIIAANELDSGNSNAIALMGLLLYEQGKEKKALDILIPLLEQEIKWENKYLQDRLGRCYFFLGQQKKFTDLELAKRLYEQSLQLGDEFAFEELIQISLASGEADKIKEFFQSGTNINSYLKARYNYENLDNYQDFIKERKDFNIKEVEFKVPEGYILYSANWVSEDELLIGCRNIQTPSFLKNTDAKFLIKLFRYSLNTKESSLIYQHKIKKGQKPYTSEVKFLNNGQIALQEDYKIILFDKKDFKVIKEIDIPEKVRHTDISYDGTKLTYSGEEGLYVANTDFSNPKVILKRKGEDVKSKHPILPRWSYNDNKIAYILGGWEWTYGLGIISPDDTKNIFFEHHNATSPRWFSDNKRIAFEEFFYGDVWAAEPSFILDISNEKLKAINGENIKPSFKENRIAYSKLVGLGYGLFIADIKSEEHYPVSNHVGVKFYHWSPDNKKLIYGVSLGDSLDEIIKIYIAN